MCVLLFAYMLRAVAAAIRDIDDSWEGRVVSCCDASDLPGLKRLVTRDNANVRMTSYRFSPFEYCCICSNMYCVKWFVIELGADPFVGFRIGLFYRDDQFQLAQWMVDQKPAIVSYLDPVSGETALHGSAAWVAMTQFLLHAKADVNALDFSGRDALTSILTVYAYDDDDDENGSYALSARLIMQHGRRVDTTQTAPTWALRYQATLDNRRHNCRKATMALMHVMRRKGAPKDLTQDWARRMIFTTRFEDVWDKQ